MLKGKKMVSIEGKLLLTLLFHLLTLLLKSENLNVYSIVLELMPAK